MRKTTLSMLPVVLAAVTTMACANDGSNSDGGGAGSPTILSVYYGLDALPFPASALCGFNVTGQDGMPVTFSAQLDQDSIETSDFAVETADGSLVEPDCATLQPAVEELELRTVLLTGTFGTPDAQPRSVEVVGSMLTLGGADVMGASSEVTTALEDGPEVVLAERYAPDTLGLQGECPEQTSQVVQLVWGGGVSGPNGAPLGEAERVAVHVELDDTTVVTPVALADDDPDNFVLACIEEATPAVAVVVDPGVFHDPGDDPNPETRIEVVDRFE